MHAESGGRYDRVVRSLRGSEWVACLAVCVAGLLGLTGSSFGESAPHVRGPSLPNHHLTPGAHFSVGTAAICRPGYSARVRKIPRSRKDAVFTRYGLKRVAHAYEVDRLVSLELGGSNAITNLWPEHYYEPWGARTKDRLERKLHVLVCSGRLTLASARRQEAANWITAYKRYVARFSGGEFPTTPSPPTTSIPATPTTPKTPTTPTTTPPPPPPPPTTPSPSSCVPPYDVSSAWNTPIAVGAAVAVGSAASIAAISDNGLALTSDAGQYTIPVYGFDSATPLVSVTGSGFFSTYDAGDGSRVGHDSPWSVQVPVPAAALGGVGSDGQVVLLDRARGIEYGFWQFTRDAQGGYSATNGYRYHTTAGYDGRFADGLAGRGDGTPYLAGLVRACELAQGHIDHALAFAYNSPSSAFVYPASKSDGGAFGGILGVDLPEGSRLQLDPTLSDTQLAAWGLTPSALVIAHALQRYGMYVVDHSGSSKLYLEDTSTAHWPPNITPSMLSTIPWSAFHVLAPRS
jgi:hypothetical protein